MPGRYKMVRCDGTCSESSVHSEGKRSPVVLRAAAPRPAAGRSRDGLMRLEWSSIEDEGRTLLGNATAAGFCRHHRRCGHHGLHSSRTRTRGVIQTPEKIVFRIGIPRLYTFIIHPRSAFSSSTLKLTTLNRTKTCKSLIFEGSCWSLLRRNDEVD